MIIGRKSPLTGQLNHMDLDVTQEQLIELATPVRGSVQEIFPDLSPDQREFLLTGYTPEDWVKIFGEDE